MGSANSSSQEDALKKLEAYVISEMKAGSDKMVIAQKLLQMGMSESDAYSVILKVAEEERFTMNPLVPAVLGGILAAIVGGGIWGLIVIATGYEIGYMACGMGLLSGYGVVLFSQRRKGVLLQVVAVLSSVLGIAIAKYASFFYFLKETITQKHGPEVASKLSLASQRAVQFFLENASSMLSHWDIIWLILAVIAAWQISALRGR
jgi:hypothetical protein